MPTTSEVHPTPIYETLAMGLVALVAVAAARPLPPGVLFALLPRAAGLERFLVEFVRRNDDVLAGLTAPQLESLALLAAGLPGRWPAAAADGRSGGRR